MQKDDLVGVASFLAETRLLNTLPFGQLLLLAASTEHYRCGAGEYIFHQGDVGSKLFIVRSGLVKIGLTASGAPQTVLAILRPGDIFGELSVLDGQPRSADAVAVEPVWALVIERDRFLNFLQNNPDAAIRILAVVASRLRNTDKLLEDAVFSQAPSPS